MDTIELDVVEIDLLTSPQDLKDLALMGGFRRNVVTNKLVTKISIPNFLVLGIRFLHFTKFCQDLPSLQRFACDKFTSLAIHQSACTMD